MGVRQRQRLLVFTCVLAIACAWSLGTLTAQTRPKRPLSYDVYDYWKLRFASLTITEGGVATAVPAVAL